MSQVIAQFRTFYGTLDEKRRRMLWGALALTAVSLLVVGVWASRDTYQVVYTSDDAEAMASAKAAIEERKIPFRLSGDGRQLSVPAEQAGEANVDIAATGNVKGLEIIETISPGTTPIREKMYILRGLQGELTRTISSLDSVKACRVHLVLPDDDVFLKSHSRGSASVVLTLEPGYRLVDRQIDGITNLVAGAVKDLDPSDVILTDSDGNLLTERPEGDGPALQAGHLEERRRSEEAVMQARVERTLAKFLGNDAHFSVAVTIELDDTSTDETRISLDPSSGVPISEQLTEETTKGSRSAGVAGSESNLPEKPPTTLTGNEQTSSQSQTNYEYTRTTTHVSRPAGTLKRVSASVSVDESALQALVAAGPGEHTLESVRASLASTIQAAMGYDAERGDTLQVTVMPFSVESAQATADLAEAPLDFGRYLPYALAALAMGLVFAFVIRPMMSRAVLPPEPALAGVGPDGNLIGVGGGQPTEDEIPLSERLRHMVDNFEAMDARELNHLVEAQTEASTQVLRRWMQSA